MLLGSGNFRAPISSDKCRRFEDSWVSDASRRKWNWVLNIFEEWRETRSEAVLKVENSGQPLLNHRIDEMSDEVWIFSWLYLWLKCGRKMDKNTLARPFMK